MDYVEEYKVAIPEQMKQLAERLERGVGADGAPLADYQLRELADLVRHEDLFLQEVEGSRVTPHFEAHRAGFTGNDPFLDSRWGAWFTTPIVEAAWNEAAGIDNEPLVKAAEVQPN